MLLRAATHRKSCQIRSPKPRSAIQLRDNMMRLYYYVTQERRLDGTYASNPLGDPKLSREKCQFQKAREIRNDRGTQSKAASVVHEENNAAG